MVHAQTSKTNTPDTKTPAPDSVLPDSVLEDRCVWPGPGTPGEHAMRCLEVWGGNGAADTDLSFHGLDGWLFSVPYKGDAGGGDVHYVSLCGRGRVARCLLADVAGHGQGTSELATRLRGMMRRHIATPDQRSLARSLNRAFADLNAQGLFATAVLLTYFAPTRHLISCLAGHMRPLWYRATADTWELLSHELPSTVPGPAGLPLGVIEPTEYYQFAVKLEPNDLIVVYTDAMIETGGPVSAAIGEQGLLDLARQIGPKPPREFGRQLIEHADHALGVKDSNRTDDLSLLVLHCDGSQPPRPPWASTPGRWRP